MRLSNPRWLELFYWIPRSLLLFLAKHLHHHIFRCRLEQAGLNSLKNKGLSYCFYEGCKYLKQWKTM